MDTSTLRALLRAAALIVLCAGTLLRSTADAQQPFPPRAVAATDACRKAALAEFPGDVVYVSNRVTPDLFRIRVTIAQKGDLEVVVICDGTSGRILRTVRIDADEAGRDGIK
jgi:hypothetical protein